MLILEIKVGSQMVPNAKKRFKEMKKLKKFTAKLNNN